MVLQEFIRSATKSVHIYCGQLNAEVYGKLQDDFADAIRQGLDVRVVCASEPLQSEELAGILRKEDHLRVLGENIDVPHFAVIDRKRYRLEIDQQKKEAFVCAYADEGQKGRIRLMETTHEILWDKADKQTS